MLFSCANRITGKPPATSLVIDAIQNKATSSQSLVVPPPSRDPRIDVIVAAVSPTRLEADIRTLAGFGTRHTLSDTLSNTRGIGAARRWIKAEFDRIDRASGNQLEVFYHRNMVKEGTNQRITKDVEIVNVVAVQRGSSYPDQYIIMSGDIDSRASDPNDYSGDAPGANDNASGMAGVLEAARILSKYTFTSSIVYAGLSGEEQGLFGGQFLARTGREAGWEVIGVLNNDMIGTIEGIDGIIENTTFRVFSEPTPATETDQERRRRRSTGGEVDGPSRQLARYVDRITDLYIPNLDAIMIYRLDRFGRGGHHRPFNDLGFPGVRIMETHENYNRQHQDVRVENGIAYGDVVEGVNFDYTALLTAVNVATLAALAWAPPAPTNVRIQGASRPSTSISWDPVAGDNLAGYRIYWRDTTAPQWQHNRFVGNVTEYTLKNIIIDNYLFGVASVSKEGNESVVVFP
ncbi:MAG: M28 family peptidase [Fidelibacterota bacterium]|nr:MAG: M28 family peptidase [Candidatus Neomarinimicrobiota bacterium]